MKRILRSLLVGLLALLLLATAGLPALAADTPVDYGDSFPQPEPPIENTPTQEDSPQEENASLPATSEVPMPEDSPPEEVTSLPATPEAPTQEDSPPEEVTSLPTASEAPGEETPGPTDETPGENKPASSHPAETESNAGQPPASALEPQTPAGSAAPEREPVPTKRESESKSAADSAEKRPESTSEIATEDPSEQTSAAAEPSEPYGLALDETRIVVGTYAELKQALGEDNGFTTVYLGADIAAESGPLPIHPSKTAAVIDGSPPTGGRYTFTQHPSGGQNGVFTADGAGSRTADVTLRNMDIVGRSDIGVVRAAGSAVITLENVNYTGPQALYHRSGAVRVLGGSYTLPGGELAEALHAELGGALTVEGPPANAVLWLTSTASTLQVLPGADVQVNTSNYFLCGSIASVHIEENARLSLVSKRFGFTYAADSVGAFTMAGGARLYINLHTTESFAALRVSRRFEMAPGSSAVILRTGTAGIALRLTAAGGAAVFNQPQRVFFYSGAGVPLRFTGAGTLTLDPPAAALTGISAPGAELLAAYTLADGQGGTTGGAADPLGQYRLPISGGTLLAGSEVTVLARWDDLFLRQRAEVSQAGEEKLAFAAVPGQISFGALPVPGAPVHAQRHQAELQISVEDTRVQPAPWRIDASLAAPANGEGSLPPAGALLFTTKDSETLRLGETPQTVYRHTDPAAGTTDIRWSRDEGLLLNVVPGEIYSDQEYRAVIHWALVDAP